MIIAIDFDGTIAKTEYPKIIEPIPGAIRTIKDLYDDGHDLILWTLREKENLEIATIWMYQRGIDDFFSEINKNLPKHIEKWESDPRKIAADIYIDDRSIGWTGWKAVRDYFCLGD